jgi:hypothetical protein
VNLPTKQPNDAEVALIGNSHMQMYEPVWETILRQRHMAGLMIVANGCVPTTGVNGYPACFPIVEGMIRTVLSLPRLRIVVLSTTWSQDMVDSSGRPVAGPQDAALARGLDATIARLHAAGKKVILIGPAPQPGYDIATVLSRKVAFGWSTELDRTSVGADEFATQYGFFVRHYEQRNDITFARADSVLWRNGRYRFILDGHVLFSDDNHLSRNEVWRYQAVFGRAFDAANRPE